MSEKPTSEVNTHKSQRRKKIILIGMTVVVFLLIGGGVALFLDSKAQETTLPKEVTNQISTFQPYLADNDTLPSGYDIEKDSIRYEAGTLFFNLRAKDKSVVVSIQPIPDEFKNTENFIGKESIDTKNGKAAITFVGGRTSAFMITKDKDAFVILNSNQSISTDDVRLILNSLFKN